VKQGVKSNKEQTTELAIQATRWLDTIVRELKDLQLKDRSELEGLRSNMEEILMCVPSQRVCMHVMIWHAAR
jgi:hypothetical protein